MPSFGKDTIRHFASNISELKKLAARDFEDILQVSPYVFYPISYAFTLFECSIPVFDGLLPEPHNSAILRLLYFCNHWHGLAKLRMHTDHTLEILDQTTTALGTEFRAFSNNTCSKFNTRELHREVEARKRHQLKSGGAGRGARSLMAHNSNLLTYKPTSITVWATILK